MIQHWKDAYVAAGGDFSSDDTGPYRDAYERALEERVAALEAKNSSLQAALMMAQVAMTHCVACPGSIVAPAIRQKAINGIAAALKGKPVAGPNDALVAAARHGLRAVETELMGLHSKMAHLSGPSLKVYEDSPVYTGLVAKRDAFKAALAEQGAT